MNSTSHLAELDLLRRQVADLSRELTERDQALQDFTRQRDDELQDLRERSDMLRAIVAGTAAETGEDFFSTLVCHLSSVLGVQYAVVGEIQHGPVKKIRTLAVSANGNLVDNFEYPLVNTPCEIALGESFACFERDVRTVFPLFGRLAQLGVDGYCGVPLRAKGGAVMGLLVLMDTKPLRNTDRLRSLMAVFASRAGAELQRRYAETKIQQQQRQLLEAQARAHLGSWDWDFDSGTVRWSEEQFLIFGYEPDHMVVSYDTFVASLHHLDRARVQSAIDAALKGGTTYDVECRIVRPDRTIRAIHCRGEVCRDGDGRPVSMSNSVLDITDHRHIEEELRLSRERLHQALRASGTGLWNWNTETNAVVFSEEWKRLVGYSGIELPDAWETWTSLLHPDDRESAVAYAMQYRARPDGDYRQEFRLRHKDGTYRWIEARASFVTEADGRRIHLLGSHIDITDRKGMEESVRESEERYRMLIELSPSGVFVFCDGRIVYLNRTGALLMGAQDPQDILDRPTFEFIHPDYHQEVRDSVTRLLGGGVSVHSAERVYVRLDGTTIPVQVEAGRIMWNGKPAILGMFSDITERKHAEEALANLNATLERQVNDRTEALRRSEERFRQFFDHAPNVTCLKSHDGRYLYTNRQFDEVFGFASGMALGRTDDELFSSEQAAQFQTHDREVLASGRGQEFEEVTQQRDGLRTSIVAKFPVIDVSGQLSAIGVIATDITERKRIQEQLRLYKEIFAHSIDGIAVIDLQGRYLQQNSTHERILGYSTDDLEGKTPAIHLGEDSFASIGRALAVTGSYRGEVKSRTREGTSLTLDLTAFTVKDTLGQPVCYVGIKRDVTERNRAQEALRESEARWQQFAESVGAAFWIADVTPDERQVVYVNAAFTFIWGIEREELYQDWSLWLDSIHPDDRLRVKTSHDRFIGGGMTAVFHCEYRIVGRDGHIRWISDRRVRMAGKENRVAGIAEDITHHKQQLALMAQTEAIGKIGGWQFDFLTGRLWWSDETYRLHETTPELFSPTVETALNFYTPDSRPIMAEAWRKGVEQGQPWDLELELISVKGRRIAVRATGQVDALEGRAVRAYGTFQDITEHKLAEEALRRAHDDLERKVVERTEELQASQERYARATAIGKVGVWELDVLNGQYHADTNLKELFGYGTNELSTDPFAWLRLVHPEDQPIAMRNWELVQSGAVEASHYELRHIRKDGSIVWGDIRARAVRDPKGRLTHLIGATVDITERKHAEQTLSESETRFRTLVANIPGAIYRCAVDREWTMSYLSDAIESIVGYPASEFIANHTRSYASVIHPDDRQLVEEVTWTSLQEHRPYVIEYRLIHANGTVRWVYEKGQGVFSSNGEVRCLDGAIFDVTERKQAEQALRESEERFSKAFRTSPHPIGITEVVTGRCVEVNDACLEAFGFRREEVIGNTTFLLGIWPKLEDRARVIERLKAGQPMRNMEFALKTKSGALRYFLASADLAELNGVLCVVTVANDITDRRLAEEALRLSEERFAKAFQASPHPVVISELDSGLVVDANEAAWQLFGYRKDEVVGLTTLQIGLWPSAEERACYLDLLKSQGCIRNMEVQLRSESGDIRQCLLSSELIELNGKQCSVTVGDDITESRRLEKALRLTQFSVDQAVEAILWLDPQAQMFNVNETACRMLQYSREELLGMTVHDIDPNFPVERWTDHWSYLKERRSLTFEARFWSRSGAVLETDVSVNYLLHEGKEYACMILRDIGERKRAEAELRRSHMFLRQVIDTDPNFIFAKDHAGYYTMANKAVADCYGTTVESLIGKSDADFNRNVEEVEFFREKDLEVLDSLEERFIPEEKITDAAGNTRWLQTVKRPIFDDEGQAHMVLGAATDITERKRMEEMLLQRERDLHAALQERERISQDLHDGILQSLYAVGLGLEACKPMIRQQPDQNAGKLTSMLNQGIGQLNHVMGEVRNFIAGLESHVIQGGDFPTALRNMIRTMCSSAAAKCVVRIEGMAARQLSTEQALHIINIVREGLSNTLRHSGASQITVSLYSLRRCVRLAIQDDGVGFDASLIQGVGHGLGNMAARARKVRGQFALHSKPNEGTRIVLDLPKDTTYAHD
ncbi:MAG: PAS domain S-box protein [Nitrospira sp.]|nr:PAS domain S-box protein [Nitrospira sp.]